MAYQSDHLHSGRNLGKLPFRTDIEGLRAVCVVAVIAFHAFPDALSGGFIGVDIFFVISGYLITRLLVGEYHKDGRIHLRRFWQRRIRRILPAATFVLLCIAALVLFSPELDARALGRHVIAAALFFYNLRQIGWSVDYLGEDQSDNPFLHYWTLSLEEQFYVLWPLLLLVALHIQQRLNRHRNARTLILIVLVFWTMSFVFGAQLVSTDHVRAFFGTFPRGWQFLSGALLAVAEPSLSQLRSRSANVLAAICLLLLLLAFTLISGRSPYPGFLALVPTMAATALIYANSNQDTLVASALSARLPRYVGRISFSLYLWHWPLLVFAHQMFPNSVSMQFASIALSFLLAVLTFHFVEQPFRHPGAFTSSLKAAYALGIGLMAFGALSGALMRCCAPDEVHIGGNVYVSGEEISRDRPVVFEDGCLLGFRDSNYDVCQYGAKTSSRTAVLFGDSHAANWFVPLDAAARATGWRLLVRVKASCVPVDAVQTVKERRQIRTYEECSLWQNLVLREMESLNPDLIIVAGTGHNFPIEAEKRMLARLTAAGRHTIAIRDTPWFPLDTVTCLRRSKDPASCEWPLEKLLLPNAFPRTPETEQPKNLRVLNLNERICPGNRCRTVQDGVAVMFDTHHFTARFAGRFAPVFEAILAGAEK